MKEIALAEFHECPLRTRRDDGPCRTNQHLARRGSRRRQIRHVDLAGSKILEYLFHVCLPQQFEQLFVFPVVHVD